MSSTTSPDTPFLAEESSNISQIDGVDDQDMPIIRELLRTWRKHYSGNILRSSYYDAQHNRPFGRCRRRNSRRSRWSPIH